MSWDEDGREVREVRYTWVPEPPNLANLLPGQWTWRVRDGLRQPHFRCPTCGEYSYLSSKWQISREGVVLTRSGRGFNSHGNGRCTSAGRYVLVGWADHQLGGS
jgi:hypothetical protein